MKQDARNMQESGLFVWPEGIHPIAEKQALLEELKDQMMHEVADPSRRGILKFPKPEGRDNDLIRSLELNLTVAKNYLSNYGSQAEEPLLMSFDLSDADHAMTSNEQAVQALQKMGKINLNNIGTSRNITVKLPGKDEFE
jgi:hypothetical protein